MILATIKMIFLSGGDFPYRSSHGCTAWFLIRSEYLRYFHIPYTFRSNLLNLSSGCPFSQMVKNITPRGSSGTFMSACLSLYSKSTSFCCPPSPLWLSLGSPWNLTKKGLPIKLVVFKYNLPFTLNNQAQLVTAHQTGTVPRIHTDDFRRLLFSANHS